MLCFIPDYCCNVSGGYLGRCVSGYLGGRGRRFVVSNASFVISVFQRWIHQGCVCSKLGVKE